MSKITDELVSRIKQEADQIQYGKITLVINETMPDIDLVVETRNRFRKGSPDAQKRILSKPVSTYKEG